MATEKTINPTDAASSEHPKQLNYLLDRVNDEIKLFTEKTNQSFRTVKIFKVTNVLLSALITIVLGVNLKWFGANNEGAYLIAAQYSMIAKDVALILGAILTLLGTLAIFWDIEKYWLQNKVTKQQLKILRNELNYLKNRETPITQDELDRIFNKFQNIMRQFHLYWEGVLQDINKKDKDDI
jgi:hypothetical protein